MRLQSLCISVVANVMQIALLVGSAHAQSKPAPQPDVSPAQGSTAIKVNTSLVLVDVVVSDHGSATRGLSQDKFRVYDNGATQKITTFEEHNAEDGLRVTAYPPLAPNTFSDFPQYRVSSAANVLLLDGLNTPLADQLYVRKQMLAYLRTIPPLTRIAVFTLASRLRLVQGFSADANLIAKALTDSGAAQQSVVLDPGLDQELSGQMSDLSNVGATQSALSSMQQFQSDLASFQTDLRVQITLNAMKSLSRYLTVIPGRKNLIWFSGSFPLSIGADSTLTSPFESMRNYADQVRETDDLLSEARVAVYPVDARGLMGLPSGTAANNLPSGGMGGSRSRGGKGNGLTGIHLPGAAAVDQQFSSQTAQEHFSMEKIAEDTGGEAFVDTSAVKDAVARSISDGSHYYTLGYVPAGKAEDGSFHKIRVEVEGGYHSAYRRGYYADLTGTASPKASQFAMNDAVEHGALQLSEILFKVKIVAANDSLAKEARPAPGGPPTAARRPKTRYLLDFAIAPQTLSFSTAPDGIHRARLEFALVAYDKEGKRVNAVDQGVGFQLTDAIYNQVMRGGIPAHQEIDLPEGMLSLRLVVRDLSSSKFGSTEVPLLVAGK